MKLNLKESTTNYRPPLIFKSSHPATIGTNLLRGSDFQFAKQETINTPDGDQLLVDSSISDRDYTVVILHGLEGSSSRPYVRNMARVAVGHGLNAVALNFRSCGGLINKKARFYHSGETEDLHFLIEHLNREKGLKKLILVGFSLGGNVLLKYLGERKPSAESGLCAAFAISVPVDLKTSALRINKWDNTLYLRRFLKSLKSKVRTKMKLFPDAADWERGLKASCFNDFDDAVTAPLHGFRGVMDYYDKSSSLQFLPEINIPTVLLNARNDSFLSEECFPDLNHHPFITSIYPAHGGHVGFPFWPLNRLNLAEQVFTEILRQVTSARD